MTGNGTKDCPVWPNPTVFPFNDGADRRGFTPPGSGCSVQFGGNRTAAALGLAQGLRLVVSDLPAALDKMAVAGIKVNEVYHIGANGKASRIDSQRQSYRSSASFQDPDGNR